MRCGRRGWKRGLDVVVCICAVMVLGMSIYFVALNCREGPWGIHNG